MADVEMLDVALSFAGEHRQYVSEVAKYLSDAHISHFYDDDRKADLWGKDLEQYLVQLYRDKSRFVVAFISREYAEKMWTQLEIKAARERDEVTDREDFQKYILPVRFDDTPVDEIPQTRGYLDAKTMKPRELANIIVEKLRIEGLLEACIVFEDAGDLLARLADDIKGRLGGSCVKQIRSNKVSLDRMTIEYNGEVLCRIERCDQIVKVHKSHPEGPVPDAIVVLDDGRPLICNLGLEDMILGDVKGCYDNLVSAVTKGAHP